MAAITICSDFGAPQIKVWHCFHCFPIYLPEVMGPDTMILVFWMLSFKPTRLRTLMKRLRKGAGGTKELHVLILMRLAWLRDEWGSTLSQVLPSFTFIKRLFSFSSLSAIRVVSFAYLKLLIFLLAILIPACVSSSQRFSWCTLHRS